MNREHPASPRIGVGELKVFLFFSHLTVIKTHDRASAIATHESVRIFELKITSLLKWLMAAIAHPSGARLIKYAIKALLFPSPLYLETKRSPRITREPNRIDTNKVFVFCFAFSLRMKLSAPSTYFETSTSSAS